MSFNNQKRNEHVPGRHPNRHWVSSQRCWTLQWSQRNTTHVGAPKEKPGSVYMMVKSRGGLITTDVAEHGKKEKTISGKQLARSVTDHSSNPHHSSHIPNLKFLRYFHLLFIPFFPLPSNDVSLKTKDTVVGCCFIKSQMCPHMWTFIIPIFKDHSVQNAKYWVCEPESRLWFSSKTSIPLVRRNTQILYNRKGIAAHRHIISKIKQRDHPFLLCLDCCSIIHGLLSPSLRLWQNRPAPEPAVLFLARWGRYQ